MNAREIVLQLRRHAPFTATGTVSGILLMWFFNWYGASHGVAETLFWSLHPLHVFVSALVTAAMYRLHSRGGIWQTLVIGYLGSVGIATISDSIIPFAGEWLLGLPNRGLHLGFIEKWWLVNPLALAGIGLACYWPRTRFPHAIHVFLSTWASLFHMQMAMGGPPDAMTLAAVAVLLFLAVWVPCCTSDIVFPLLCIRDGSHGRAGTSRTGGKSR